MNNSRVPPDVCVNSSDKDRNHPSAEYGALVSSIKLKSKEVFIQNTSEEEQETDSSSNPSRKGKNNPSSAMDIFPERSSPGVVKSLYYKHFRQSYTDPITLESSASSLSESDSRTSTPGIGEKRSRRMHFSIDSCTHCDHRLKLYFETKMFKDEDEEMFCCMIKVQYLKR